MRVEEGRGRAAWPPEYSVRVSPRARRVRLVMRASGLEVVVPHGISLRGIPRLLEERREWIRRASQRIEEERRRLKEDPPRLPDRITLPAVGEEWVVEYRRPGSGTNGPGGRDCAVVREIGGRTLRLTGEPDDYSNCRAALYRWLGRRARRELVPRLDRLAREHGFVYERVSVRQQRTRWGSCSRRGSISLNARLLFMPPQAVDYVLLHELCHTVRMDHSRAFWNLLERYDPDYRVHKKMVRDGAKELPSWVEHRPNEDLM